jgi:hypothetical protein
MIFPSLGLPSPYADRCDAILGRLAAAALGETGIIAANTIEEIARGALKSPSSHLVVSSRDPMAGLLTALASAGRPFLLVLDDPRASCRELMARGIDWRTAARTTANTCAALLAYATMTNAFVLRAGSGGGLSAETMGAIAGFFGLALSDADLAGIAATQSDHPAQETDPAVEEWWNSLDRIAQETIEGALRGYIDHFRGKDLGPLIWNRELFFIGDQPHQPANVAVDVSGGERYLLFGPYIALPIGNWSATIALAVSRAATDLSFRVEAAAGPDCRCLGEATFQAARSGVCKVVFDFAVDETTVQPIQIRVFNRRMAFRGELAFGQAVLQRRRLVSAKVAAELMTALGL